MVGGEDTRETRKMGCRKELLEVGCVFETDINFADFGINAGSDRDAAGVVGDPNFHFPLLLEKPIWTK